MSYLREGIMIGQLWRYNANHGQMAQSPVKPTIHEPIRFQITREVTGLGLSVPEHQVMIPSTRNVFYSRGGIRRFLMKAERICPKISLQIFCSP